MVAPLAVDAMYHPHSFLIRLFSVLERESYAHSTNASAGAAGGVGVHVCFPLGVVRLRFEEFLRGGFVCCRDVLSPPQAVGRSPTHRQRTHTRGKNLADLQSFLHIHKADGVLLKNLNKKACSDDPQGAIIHPQTRLIRAPFTSWGGLLAGGTSQV